MRMGYISQENDAFKKLGNSQRSRTRNIIQAVIKESAEKGRVSFEKSETAEIFSRAHDFMFQGVYAKADERIDFSVLEKAYRLIEESEMFSQCEPVIVFALMSEEDIGLIASTSEENVMEKLGIKEILRNIKGLEISDFESFLFNKKDFVV